MRLDAISRSDRCGAGEQQYLYSRRRRQHAFKLMWTLHGVIQYADSTADCHCVGPKLASWNAGPAVPVPHAGLCGLRQGLRTAHTRGRKHACRHQLQRSPRPPAVPAVPAVAAEKGAGRGGPGLAPLEAGRPRVRLARRRKPKRSSRAAGKFFPDESGYYFMSHYAALPARACLGGHCLR